MSFSSISSVDSFNDPALAATISQVEGEGKALGYLEGSDVVKPNLNTETENKMSIRDKVLKVLEYIGLIILASVVLSPVAMIAVGAAISIPSLFAVGSILLIIQLVSGFLKST